MIFQSTTGEQSCLYLLFSKCTGLGQDNIVNIAIISHNLRKNDDDDLNAEAQFHFNNSTFKTAEGFHSCQTIMSQKLNEISETNI